VLETKKRREEKKRKRLGLVQPKSSLAWHTLGKNWWGKAIIHWTVRRCTGLPGEPTAASATVGRAIHGRRVARANGRQGAPDCPVCQLAQRCNGHLRKKRKEIRTGLSTVTVRRTTRQKATLAFLVGIQRLLAALGL
jgi:hypothetical protein